jgi:hypothetical protein
MIPSEWPTTLREINNLPEEQKHAIYATLLPDWLFTDYDVDRKTLRRKSDNHQIVDFRCPAGTRAMEISVKQHPADLDPMLYLNMTDTFNNQLLVLLVVVNDPEAPRFNTDVDPQGNPTNFGTSSRNLIAEEEAMKAGLAPGQIRAGKRVFKQSVPQFEEFVKRMSHERFFIEPLTYSNAITFERYGFNYLRGAKEMSFIHQEFQPGGELHSKLTPQNPFRHPDAWKTVRGRAWAIHDGILGHPFSGFQMYKRVGHHAGVCTFPEARW